MADYKVVVSSSPHLKTAVTTPILMRDVVIALLPAALAAIVFFGMNALTVMLVSVVSAVASEALFQKITGKAVTIGDFSAVVTGLLLAFNLPASVPLWIPVVGSAFAMIIVKQLFGGLGQNFLNPALAARAVLLASWPAHLTAVVGPFDVKTTATALVVMKTGQGQIPSLFDMFIGNMAGQLGETSALALIIGALYLLARKVIDWRTPVSYLGTVFVLTALFGRDPLSHLLAGGLMLGALFMATDYVTTPVTKKGRIIFGVGAGLITVLIRLYGGYPEGVTYAILLMNIATPLIDRFTVPRRFGYVKRS
ncbi:MAG: RnfABCDGE type electron transport complex subunit D [Bacillota bacterium]